MARESITKETCLSCGACCIAPYDQEAFCDVTASDERRLGERFVRLHVLRERPIDFFAKILDGRKLVHGAIETKWRKQRSGPMRGYEINACFALRGSALSCVRCSIYETRPRACREAVKPGDRVCREIRQALKNSLV